MPTTNRRPTADDVLDALADEKRLLVVRFLRDLEDAVHVETLASHLAAQTCAEASTLRASLHHAHLPKLDEVGLLRYDAVAGTVRPADDCTDAAEPTAVLEDVDHRVPGG